jgi:hypothetical protein
MPLQAMLDFFHSNHFLENVMTHSKEPTELSDNDLNDVTGAGTAVGNPGEAKIAKTSTSASEMLNTRYPENMQHKRSGQR